MLGQPAAQALMVYGEASSTGPTIAVNVYADITNTPLISFGFSVTFDPQALAVQSAVKNSALWYLSDGTNQVAYANPDTSTPGQVRFLGAKLDALNPLQGVSGLRTLLGTVTFTRLTNGPVTFGLALAQAAPFANFVSTSGVNLDTATGGVVLAGVQNDPKDTDLNGLPDAWETKYFGGLGKTTWSDDPDHDGFNNRQEYLADTNPTNSISYLGITSAARVGGGVSIQWHGGVQARQVLQRRFSLNPSDPWVDVFTNLPPTAVDAGHVDPIGPAGGAYYRIRAGD
jgi:hypothetical protein